jgi:SAM domain (Sterile alpha motif)
MDIAGWLRSLSLQQYEAMFRGHEIDGEVLPELVESDLEKLGLPLGHRKRLPSYQQCALSIPLPAKASSGDQIGRSTGAKALTNWKPCSVWPHRAFKLLGR